MTEDKIFKVSEFNEFINLYLEGAGEVVVEGEISSVRVNQNKWLFVTIKDKESSVEVFGVVFKISGYDILETGMLVRVYGTPRLYQKTGRFSIFAENIVPAGEGALRLAFERLKLKLESEGLFDDKRKRPTPVFPEKIGLITAKDSRAYGDFVKVLGNRMGGMKIHFFPVNVQGKNSTSSVVSAFDYFNNKHTDLDLLVLVRGGGSLEDLQSFNDEKVARAIFSSKIPVVCGIGHEDDVSIADLVADVRASTPSNAAELIVRERRAVLNDVNYCLKAIDHALNSTIIEKTGAIVMSVNTIKSAFDGELSRLHKRINRFKLQFVHFSKDISSLVDKTSQKRIQLISTCSYWTKQNRLKIGGLVRVLKTLDYSNTLKRGFTITLGTDGEIIKSIRGVKKGQKIATRLYDGKIGSQVVNVRKS